MLGEINHAWFFNDPVTRIFADFLDFYWVMRDNDGVLLIDTSMGWQLLFFRFCMKDVMQSFSL
jgi:hypothetical protein